MKELPGQRGGCYVRNDRTGFTPLTAAASFGRNEIIQLLLEKGAKINAKGQAEKTPLIAAA
jgi:ankyrin repeat protein